MTDLPKVFFDVSIKDKPIGRIVFELFADKAPLATENFLHICKGDVSKAYSDGTKTLTFKDNFFHRIIKNFMIQAGDIVYGSGPFDKSDNIGTGGCSIYATDDELKEKKDLACYGYFKDENLGEFTEPFLLAMATTGEPNTNTSQFFVVTYPSPHLNNKHTILGKVLHGKSVIRTVEYSEVDSDGFPLECVRISDCGEWNDSMPIPLFNASNNPICGDIYEEYPGDDTHFDQEKFDECFKAANTIKEAGSALFKLKDYQNAYYKYKKSLSYVNEFIPEKDVDIELNAKFIDLKIKLYLNLCLLSYNLKEYDQALDYATYALETEGIDTKDKAKAYYRTGNTYLVKKAYDDALKNFKLCKENNPDDKVVDSKIEHVQDIIEKNKEKTKKNIAKFFS